MNLTSWTCVVSFIISINQVWFQSDFHFSNDLNFTFWDHLTTDLWWPLTLVYNLCLHLHINCPYCIQTKFGSIRLQLFKCDHFYIFYQLYNLTSNDLWPWYDFCLHQQMRVPMLHLWPNFGWNPPKHVEVTVKLTHFHNNRGQSNPYCVFSAKTGDTQARILQFVA